MDLMRVSGVALLGLLCACGRTEPVGLAGPEAPSVDAGRADAGPADAGQPEPRDAGHCPTAFGATASARVAITADNRRTLWVNGALLERTDAEWYSETTLQVPVWIHPGRENVIAVEASNLTTAAGFDRGLLLSMTLGQSTLVTDDSWRQRGVDDGGWSPVNDAWLQPGFDASAWGAAVEQAPNGAGPWGLRASIDATAWWVWSYASNINGKVDVEPVLFRRAFYVSPDGGLSATPSPCP